MSALTIPLDPATDAALEEMAASSKRAKADIAAEMLADYVSAASDHERLVREAREDFAAGRTFTHEDVAASAKAIIETAAARR
jgi:predicted transcriptional regulator